MSLAGAWRCHHFPLVCCPPSLARRLPAPFTHRLHNGGAPSFLRGRARRRRIRPAGVVTVFARPAALLECSPSAEGAAPPDVGGSGGRHVVGRLGRAVRWRLGGGRPWHCGRKGEAPCWGWGLLGFRNVLEARSCGEMSSGASGGRDGTRRGLQLMSSG